MVCINIEFLQEPVHEYFPVGLAVLRGCLLKAVGGVVATYPQHITHRIPELRGPVKIERLVFERHWRPAKEWKAKKQTLEVEN